jgi:hypothetical protein
MGVALLFPHPDKRGRGKEGKSSETDGFSQTRLKLARAVLAYSRELALKVRDGTEKLDAALATMEEARKALEPAKRPRSSTPSR